MQELAAEVEGLQRGKHKRRRYPAELRRCIAHHVREQRAAGVPLNELAQGPHSPNPLLGEIHARRRAVSEFRAAAGSERQVAEERAQLREVSERDRNPETVAKRHRRVFSAADKLRIVRIVKEVDQCLASGKRGALGAMLRREGIYSVGD